MPMKAYKYKLKPSAKVIAIFESWLVVLCELYNAALQERRDAYRISHQSIGLKEQSAQLPEIKKERPDLARIYSQVVQESLKRVDLAFKNFFRRVSEKAEKAGFPRFRSRSRYDSFTYPQSGFSLKGNKLHLSKIGKVKVHLSRPIEGRIKTCTIKREADGWYAVFAVEKERDRSLELAPEESVGIDVGIESFATLSTGEQVDNPKFLRAGESELKTAQRRVSRRERRSKRRKKAVVLLAKKHQKIARQRRHFHFKEARKLTRKYRVIKVEKLNIKGMVKNHHLAKSISDVGWGEFISILASKAEEAGGEVVKVNPAYTSQRCSRCGHRHKMPLSMRIYRCGQCGLIIHRDHNGAINIVSYVS